VSQSHLLRERRFAPFFAVQFTGAFNDNAFKQAIVIYFAMTLSQAEAEHVSLLASAMFIAPYFLFSATAGQLAEKYDKAKLVRATKVFEIALMVLAGVAFQIGSIHLLLALLMLLGLQATIFGPAKYAILPAVLAESELVGGNALVETGTYVAILVGQIAGAEVVALNAGTMWVAAMLVVCASLGWFAARAMPPVPSSVPDLQVSWNVFSQTWQTIQFARELRSVWLSILGISWFWLYGALFLSELPAFVETVIGGQTNVVTLCIVFFSLGVGTGSLLCERLSAGHIELGLVPLGSIGLSLFGIDLFFASEWHHAVGTGLSSWQVLTDGHHIRILADFTLIGLFGGLYSVPLFALVQHRSPESKRSRVIAGNNIINSLFIVAAAVLAAVCRGYFGLSVPQVFLVGAILNALVAIYIYTLLPEFLLRFLAWLLVNTMYRLKTRGAQNIPNEGAALVVCNHVSFVDSLIVGAMSHRPIRFVMYYRIYQSPVLGWIFRMAKAIPIAGKKEDPELMERAFDEVKKCLDEGELVGIFPEGMITYTGEINAFRPGVERILAASPVPVVPMALRGLWGSFFSRMGGRAMTRPMRRFWSKIELEIGELVPASEANAARLEADVRALRGEWK
jgi:1-acyl-sn-glycerol-3-phosphate acyltransferase